MLGSGKQSGRMLQSTIIVTIFLVVGQGIGFITQVVIASAFGARADMDAFLAAVTLPQYIIAVLLNSLNFAFIPIAINYLAKGREEEARQLTSTVVNLSFLVLGIIAVGGIVFAEPLLRLTTPGLTPASLHLASKVAMITWPTIVATGLISLLTALYQARNYFSWPAAVPVIGGLINLGLVLWLAASWGVTGLALAATCSAVVQVVLLFFTGVGRSHYRLYFNWRHPGVREVIRLALPLIVSGLLVRWTPVMDRYLASNLPEGSISHLGYAFKLISVLAPLVSTGFSVVIFPKMALEACEANLANLKDTISQSLRLIWLVVAPVIVLGGVLAGPLVTLVFMRGKFTAGDALAVAGLLQVYLLSMVGSCLGSITGRSFYALKDTRTISIMGIVEALAYVVYTPFLAHRFGALGIAWGFVIYYNLSVFWQVFLIRYKTGKTGGRTVIKSFARTILAAVAAGAVTWGFLFLISGLPQKIMIGGSLGLAVYLVLLYAIGSPELRIIWDRVVAGRRFTS